MGDSGEQVKLVSRAMVPPAQPTPPQHFFLPCLDIFWQDIHYNQRLLFYETTGAVPALHVMQQLKSSLALCLVHYYPWCGRIAKGPLPPHRLFIDCNDAGVEFVEASTDLPLSSLAQHRFQMKPFFLHLSQFPDHKGDSLFRSPLLSIQATLFSDGGLALGIAQSHMVADGQSLWNFMVSWGECSRGVPLSLPPLHNRERLAVLDPSPEKASTWTLAPQMKEEDKEEQEMDSFVVEQNDKDNGSTSVETLASLGDNISPSMETLSTIPDKSSSNASSVVGEQASSTGTIALTNGDIATCHVGNDPSANGDNANRKGQDPFTQGSKKSRAEKHGNLGTEPLTDDKDCLNSNGNLGTEPLTDDKDSLNSNGDKESIRGTKVSLGDESNLDPLVQCVFDLPSLAIKKLKGEAGEAFTSYEVICAHFWQRVTIARQSPRCDPTYFVVLANCRSRVTPPLPPAYFGNVITFCVAQSTVGKIGSESLSATASRIHEIIAQAQEDRLVSLMHWLETHDNRFANIGSSAPKGKGLNVASSPRFPAYQVDFGWGTPVAIRPVKAGGEGELVLFGGRPGSIQGDVEICTALPGGVLRRLLEDTVFLAKLP